MRRSRPALRRLTRQDSGSRTLQCRGVAVCDPRCLCAVGRMRLCSTDAEACGVRPDRQAACRTSFALTVLSVRARTRVMMPAIVIAAPTAHIPAFEVPVRSVSQPVTEVARKPAALPIVLMSAMAAAAAAPVRNACGSGQKHGSAQQIDMQAIVTAIIVVNGEVR